MESRPREFAEPSTATPAFALVTALLVGTLLSLLVVVIRGVPAPRIQDEFAYLLSADTFAHGRVTNPTHPMWQHFESFHIIHQPSYNSKYPPMQALTLALGQWLGHPILGSCLASGVSIAALVWMLYGWLPSGMHRAAWWIAVAQPSFHFFFAHSYMGGAVALTGASLLLGAFARLGKRLDYRLSLLAAIGILLMANSRPFEGLVLTVAVAIGLVFRFRQLHWNLGGFSRHVAIPAALVLMAGGMAMGRYNQQVTGSILTMPYQVHESTYGWNPVFIWQQAGAKPEYRHQEMEQFFSEDKEHTEQTYSTLSGTVACKFKAIVGLLAFYCGPMILLGVSIFVYRYQGLTPYLIGFLTPVFLASIVSKWANFHYAAPAAPLLMATMLGGCWVIWEKLGEGKVRRMIFAGLIAFHGIWFINVVSNTGKIHRGNWGRSREAIARHLIEEPKPDLVLVRYRGQHSVHQEWVYNGANIDQAEIVWAREINEEKRQQLIEYYHDRRVWILTVGEKETQLTELPSYETATAQQQQIHETY